MGEVCVRPFEPENIAAFHRIYSHPLVVPDILQPPSISLEERKRQVASSRGKRFHVAELDGNVVGAGDLQIYSGRRNHAGLIDLAVDPDHWRQGIGSALMKAMIELGENWYGLRRIELKVFESNSRGIGLCERFGFQVEATHKDFALRDGQLATALTMARLKSGGTG